MTGEQPKRLYVEREVWGAWTGEGLVTHYLLFVINLADRVVNIAGITTLPDESWMLQIARNLTDSPSGALHAKRYLIIDRDTKNSQQFRRLVQDSGTNVIRLPPMSPYLNAHAERFVRSIKDECLDRMIFVGQASLRRAVTEYMNHFVQNGTIKVSTAMAKVFRLAVSASCRGAESTNRGWIRIAWARVFGSNIVMRLPGVY